MRQALLISAAAIALTAASTLAYSQGSPNAAPGGGAGSMSTPQAAPGGAARGEGGAAAPAGAPGTPNGQITDTPTPGKGTQDRTVPDKQRTGQQAPGTKAPNEKQGQVAPHEQPGASKQGASGQQPAGAKSAEQPMTSKNVSLTTEQKTTIRTKVLTNSAPRVNNVNFDIKIGVAVPRTVRVVPVPATIIEIEPQWRGYMYFVSGDTIIIVEPRTLEIVAVLDV